MYDYIYYSSVIKMHAANNVGNKSREQKTENLAQRINFIDSIYNQRKDNFYHIQLYGLQVALRQLNNLPSPIKTESAYQEEYRLIDKCYTGLSKEYLLTDLMQRTVAEDKALTNTIRNNFFKNINNKRNKAFIKSAIEEKNKTEKNKAENLVDVDYKAYTLENILGKNKGKVILIDLWATWCAPCIEEFPHGKKLKNNFDEKVFTIIYLSIDKNKDAWRINSKELNFQSTASFALAGTQYPAKIRKYIKRTIPQYILIGKDGNIISADAPRPSDPELKKLIEENL